MTVTAVERIEVDGVGLEARWIGPGPTDAPTIVFLHDGLGSAGRWGDWPDRLARATGCGGLLFSRAGHGRSDPASTPRSRSDLEHQATRILPQVLEAVGFQRGFLLGHGDGAAIATMYAGGVEDFRVRGVVLIAPHFFVDEAAIARVERARAAYEAGELRHELAPFHGANVDAVFRAWSGRWLDPEFRSWDIRDTLNYIRVPILVLEGAEDPADPEAQVEATREETYCPVEVVVVEGAGAAPHLDDPERTLATASEFVTTLTQAFGEWSGRAG